MMWPSLASMRRFPARFLRASVALAVLALPAAAAAQLPAGPGQA